MKMNRTTVLRRSQRGAATTEYAVTVIYWVALTFAVLEFGRVMYLITATHEATRIGARYAVVCSQTEAQVKARMKAFLPILTDANINITFAEDACTAGVGGSCPSTNVSISGVSFNTIVPLAPMTFSLPPAHTSMYPETRRASADPVCS